MRLRNIPISQMKTFVDSAKSINAEREGEVRIAYVYDQDSTAWLVEAIKTTLAACDSSVEIVELKLDALQFIDDEVLKHLGSSELCVLCAGIANCQRNEFLDQVAGADLPCYILAETSVELPYEVIEASDNKLDWAVVSDKQSLETKLGEWLLAHVEHPIALAASNESFRNLRVQRLMNECARENAVVGALQIIPGADLPVMTINQIKMALDIAACYGHKITPERIPEIVSVIAAGMAFRAVARTALGFIPWLGWALKAAIGYSGTLSVGKAVKFRFDAEKQPETPLQTRLADLQLGAQKAAANSLRGLSKGMKFVAGRLPKTK